MEWKKKYKLTEEFKEVDGRRVYRIQALKNFRGVRMGDSGGFVESEKNLSQAGNCWVFDDSAVYDGALIAGNAVILDGSEISENSRILENAKITGKSKIRGSSVITNNANISHGAIISGRSRISGYMSICGEVFLTDIRLDCGLIYSSAAPFFRRRENSDAV